MILTNNNMKPQEIKAKGSPYKSERKLLSDFYLHLIKIGYSHRNRLGLETKAELFMRDYPTQPTEQAHECNNYENTLYPETDLCDNCNERKGKHSDQPILTNTDANVNKEADKVEISAEVRLDYHMNQRGKYSVNLNEHELYEAAIDALNELLQVKPKQVTEGDKYKLYDMFGKYLNTLGYAIEFDPDGFWFEELIEDKIKEFAEISVGFSKWMQEQLRG